ncbi:MAG: FAD-dependent oxidoreductase [Hydrocarboniphaga sp.]|uniref:FAD-dependent oxidoreductase n=1 Tax=Hydrocarboniphaga sp. TaxID=2033016 RepID=UPI0026017BE9|nr:FAD-dependent oxidoreductase [Hydrocarboniphaga sp.]MDB5971973.1 FAD-dependent oxidoreductase [Hydrocarboniphaga sp.]
MGINEPQWDAEYDVIVVGSGAGGMTAALCAKQQGLSALVIEKDVLFGGTSAVSGGGIWIPNNHDIAPNGGSDSFEEALTYLKHLIGDATPIEKIEAYLQHAPQMVQYIGVHFDLPYHSVVKYPDYYSDQPGGKDGWRSMEPFEIDAARLGDDYERMRAAYPGTMLMGRISMNQVEAHTLFSRGPGWVWLMLKMFTKYWTDFRWRRKTPRDRRLTLGQALVARLRLAMKKNQVPLQLETGMESLIQQPSPDGDRVVGIVVNRQGRKLRYKARRGVMLACGGFESNQAMREQYLPHPTSTAWSAAPPINHGDGIRAGQSLGAALRHMNLVWGSPTVRKPGTPQQITLFVERGMPGCVAINQQGRRFVNEAAAYPDFLDAMYADQARGNQAAPCWLVFDATFRYKYPMGIFLPGQIEPDSRLPKDWLDQVYYRADTLTELSKKIGVDPAELAKTVAAMNRYASTGVDTQFGKGSTPIDRYYSDPSVKPNTCLGPIVKAPFYAVKLDAGDIGTKGGLVTDVNARVLREDGSVIEGLYATGNTTAAVMGPKYPGAGATLGPAMTFGYLGAMHMAKASVSVAATA